MVLSLCSNLATSSSAELVRKMFVKKQLSCFCAAFAAQFFTYSVIAQPAGLQGAFIPLEVISVNAAPNETIANVNYYAQTLDYASIYAQEQSSFSKGEVVDLAGVAIGTPWEGATCAVLLDAGFEVPCAIPPNLPADPSKPPEYEELGSCISSYGSSAYDSTNVTLNECKALVVGGATNGGSVNARFDSLGCSGETVQVKLLSDYWTSPNISGFWGANSAAAGICASAPPPPYEDPEPPTTDEIYDIIRPAVTNNYFYDYGTQRPITSPGNFTSTATTITNTYNNYISTWTAGDSYYPSGQSPVPIPSAPSAPTSPTASDIPDMCVDSPGSVACADAVSFVESIGDSVADSLVEEVQMPDGAAAAAEVASTLAVGLQAVGQGAGGLSYDGGMFSSYDSLGGLLPGAGGCANFQYPIFPEYGMSINIDTCQLAVIRTIVEWILYVLTIFALYRIALGKKGDTA